MGKGISKNFKNEKFFFQHTKQIFDVILNFTRILTEVASSALTGFAVFTFFVKSPNQKDIRAVSYLSKSVREFLL